MNTMQTTERNDPLKIDNVGNAAVIAAGFLAVLFAAATVDTDAVTAPAQVARTANAAPATPPAQDRQQAYVGRLVVTAVRPKTQAQPAAGRPAAPVESVVVAASAPRNALVAGEPGTTGDDHVE